MKNSKLNISFLVSILIIGFTLTTQAKFGQKVVTRCLTQITLQNAAGSVIATLDATISAPIFCQNAKAQVVITPYVRSAVFSTSLPNEAICDDIEVFCCVKVTELSPTDPGFSNTPAIDLGEGLKKYKIASPNDVFCKISE